MFVTSEILSAYEQPSVTASLHEAISILKHSGIIYKIECSYCVEAHMCAETAAQLRIY